MGGLISCSLKLVLQVFNAVLCVAFLAVALFGILLKSSRPVVKQLLEKIFDRFEVGNSDLREMAKFITDNADGIAVALIVVGLTLAALCLVGYIASCCGFKMLLKIYAIILLILLVAEVIIVAVLFSDSTRLTSQLANSMEGILSKYGGRSEEGRMSTAVWNVLMTIDSLCCGMDGYEDFMIRGKTLPPQCCSRKTGNCTPNTAESTKMPGCREKIVQFTTDNLKFLLYGSIVAILLQTAVLLIVLLTIRV